MTDDKAQVNEQNEEKETEENTVHEESASAKKEIKKDKAHKKSKVEEQLEEQLEKSQNEIAELKDKHLRLQAEFDNYRKRTLKERMDLQKSASESLLISLLPVIDDFDRAMKTLDLVKDESPVKDGVLLIYNKFQEFLKKNGVKEIEAKEKDFDTDLHEAITKIPAPSEDLKGKIVDVVQKGYILNDKVIRFSKVIIGE